MENKIQCDECKEWYDKESIAVDCAEAVWCDVCSDGMQEMIKEQKKIIKTQQQMLDIYKEYTNKQVETIFN
jgi:hypothetical protein